MNYLQSFSYEYSSSGGFHITRRNRITGELKIIGWCRTEQEARHQVEALNVELNEESAKIH